MTTITPRASVTAAAASRTITGLALPFGVPGHSSRGTVTVARGAVDWAADLKRIKLYRDHSDANGSPVGYATAVEETDEGISMSFRIGETPDGDAALADIREGIRDALSVEIMGAEIGGGGRLTGGTITAVALVAVPAFADARVSAFTASLHTTPAHTPAPTPGDRSAFDNGEEITVRATSGNDADDDRAGKNATTPASTPEATPAGKISNGHDADDGVGLAEAEGDELAADDDADAADDDLGGDAADVDNPGDNDPVPSNQENQDMTTPKTAAAPSGLTAARTIAPTVTFAAVVDSLLGVRAGREPDDLMTAALADITRSAHPAVASSGWLGELWSGIAFNREIIPTMTTKRLTSMRATGWRWTTKPVVDDYAGDKTEIPSNTPSTEAVTLTPRRLAGGHDIDRAYIDFNDSEFLASYFKAMTESYAMVSDDRAATFLVAEAGNNIGPRQADMLRAAAKARQLVKRGTRTEATSYLVHPDDMFGLMDITQIDNPTYLDLLGIDPAKFLTNDAVEPGTVVAYAKPAVEFHELGESPIRVEAEHLAQGGRDAAVFGYYVPFVANPAGIVSVPFGASE